MDFKEYLKLKGSKNKLKKKILLAGFIRASEDTSKGFSTFDVAHCFLEKAP